MTSSYRPRSWTLIVSVSLQRLHFEHTAAELEAAGTKTIEIMRASPYQKMAKAGLFLKALASQRGLLPQLLAANLGNQLANPEALARLAEFMSSAPELQDGELDQIAALPLSSRIKVDPWSGQITLVKTRPLELLSPREKMPFEITPFALCASICGQNVFQMFTGFLLHLGVQAVSVRIHRHDRSEVVRVQVPHGLGNPEVEQVDAQHLIDRPRIKLRRSADRIQIHRA